MTKAQAAKRVYEAKTKLKKVYYEIKFPLTTAQNRQILKAIEDLDKVEFMFRKM